MHALSHSPRLPAHFKRMLQWLLLGGVVAATLVTGQSPGTPEINLSPEPLYMNGAKTKTNITLALSVEEPTVGQAHRGGSNNRRVLYDHTQTYLGYFDSEKCYTYNTGNTSEFDEHSPVDVNTRRCNGGKFSGNFMNWATASAIDIFRIGLTGGNRVEDRVGKTVLERAWLPDRFYRSKELFSPRYISRQDAQGLVEQSLYTQIPGGTGGTPNNPNTQWDASWGGMWIYNCKNRVYFATAEDRVPRPPTVRPQPLTPLVWGPDDEGDCDIPFNTAFPQNTNLNNPNTSHPMLMGPNGNTGWYEVRVEVCKASTATDRLMQYDAVAKKWSGLCYQYGRNNYKPVGQLQMHAESARVAVFGYLGDNLRSRYGGVLRAPMKYLGPKDYDSNFNLLPTVNANREWDDRTGILVGNPHAADSQGFGVSGAINYINKFGTFGSNPALWGKYKSRDPVSELYYEALRYIQGNPPTPDAVDNLTPALKDNFPVYTNWTDPFHGFVDAGGTTASCLRNSIVTVADAYTHSDRSIPGNTITTPPIYDVFTGQSLPTGEWARPVSDANPPFDVMHWTRVVGSFESKTTATSTVTYTDSQGRTQIAGNLPGFTPLNPSQPFPNPWVPAPPTGTLEDAQLLEAGSNGGSYYLAGMAYWANTQQFHPTHSKARVKTYVIDVNERQDSSTYPDYRRTRQLHLAAKYGGFNDADAGNTGNPYFPGSNALWQDTNRDAKNYFLASDALKFLDSIAEIFAKVVDETGSIAGGAISTQRITSTAAGAVFQARFNPNANYWSGRVLKNTVTFVTTGLVLNQTPAWEAGQVLTADAKRHHGTTRKIVIGPPAGQHTVLATDFLWNSLDQSHQTALSSNPQKVTDTLGPLRVNYLRGDQRNEIAANNQAGYFRPRDIVLGDVVNSGLVYMGPPDPTSMGYVDSANSQGATYRAFTQSKAGRQKVVFVNANDGMLHAFDEGDGKEAFAYIPGFIAGKLNLLPERDYMHASLADATPATADVFLDNSRGWRTALVSGVGGGGQGVFALDVTDPTNFTATNAVLWEFTDRDHKAMGNVIGTPRILKFREQDATAAGTHTYKTLAVVASGVNNYANDGFQHSGPTAGAPSLFFLDMNRVSTQPWVEGQNFWRIELPQSEQNMAKGLVSFNSVTDPATGVVNTLYAGDLQGNLWKLDFSSLGFRPANITNDPNANFGNFNPIHGDAPLFIAQYGNPGVRQPLTGTPEIVNSYFGKKLVVFGSGKFLESTDTTVPLTVKSSVYAVLDDPAVWFTNTQVQGPIPDRSWLQGGSVSANGTVTMPPFTVGAPPRPSPNIKAGWYIDLDASIGERQVSDITAVNNRLILASLFPTRGSCGEGGGRIYSLDSLTGAGYSVESQVGVLAAPLVMSMGTPLTSPSGTTGRRMATDKIGVVSQGAKGLQTTTIVDTFTYPAGRMSWRLVNNHAKQ